MKRPVYYNYNYCVALLLGLIKFNLWNYNYDRNVAN